jgi:hypothetical protein
MEESLLLRHMMVSFVVSVKVLLRDRMLQKSYMLEALAHNVQDVLTPIITAIECLFRVRKNLSPRSVLTLGC